MAEATTREARTSNRVGSTLDSRLAGAPISWGVCEVPGWGVELPRERVLSEMSSLGLRATETGPIGYLGRDPREIEESLARHGLRLVGGFIPVVLHDRAAQADSIAATRRFANLLGAAGASVLVSAVVLDLDWSAPVPLSDTQWRAVWDGLARVDEATSEQGLSHVTHPHWGTLIALRHDVVRVLEESNAQLCLDTGHLLLGGADPVWLAASATERIGHVHLKDVSNTRAEQLRSNRLTFVEAVRARLFRPLGSGDVAVAETVRTLEAGGYDGWYVLEQDCALATADLPEGEGPIADVRRSVAFVKTLSSDVAA